MILYFSSKFLDGVLSGGLFILVWILCMVLNLDEIPGVVEEYAKPFEARK